MMKKKIGVGMKGKVEKARLAALLANNPEALALLERAFPTTPRYQQFQERYWSNPVGFVQAAFNWKPGRGPKAYQLDVLKLLIEFKRVAVRSPHGVGKSTIAAFTVLWFLLTRDGVTDWKIVTTASVWRQLEKYLWPEIRLWISRLNWEVIGRQPFSRFELLQLQIKLSTGEAFAAASDDPAYMEGAHATQLLFIYDESKAIKDETFDATEGAFSNVGNEAGNEAYALALSTPGPMMGRFYDIHMGRPGLEFWKTRHITLEEAILAGQISRDWAEERKRQWGERSALFQNRVMGNFAADDENVVIPLAWVEEAIQRWLDWQDKGKPEGEFYGVGVDVGLGGDNSDLSAMALCFERWRIAEIRKWQKSSPDMALMDLSGRIVQLLDAYKGFAVIDGIGIGAGVYQRVKEQKYKIESFIASLSTEFLDESGKLGFSDLRSAAWWAMREILNPQSGIPVALPPDNQLLGELTAPTFRSMSNGKIKVESKGDMKERLRRSTDSADAVIQILTWEIVGAKRLKMARARAKV